MEHYIEIKVYSDVIALAVGAVFALVFFLIVKLKNKKHHKKF